VVGVRMAWGGYRKSKRSRANPWALGLVYQGYPIGVDKHRAAEV